MDEVELEQMIAAVKEAQEKLTDSQRMEFWHEIQCRYCKHCGCTDPRCKCWNDE
jgi:hypothetical protein